MLLIVHQCFLMMLSRKIIVHKTTLQTTNNFFRDKYCFEEFNKNYRRLYLTISIRNQNIMAFKGPDPMRNKIIITVQF